MLTLIFTAFNYNSANLFDMHCVTFKLIFSFYIIFEIYSTTGA